MGDPAPLHWLRRPGDARANNLAHWQIAIATRDAANGALHATLLVRDPDGHAVLLRSR
ncbi:MAG: hypothetical protein HY615_03540 [Candidatus Rokubacteria bacterium]|nr:hypothetical protein [Candidatus Rokubacteria bacterium]